MHRGDRVAGRFEILGEAGRGGMGTVFRARDRRDKREVALKVLSAGALSTARFEREAVILAGLRHPNIVDYVAHGVTPDGIAFLVMEWVDGETLSKRLDRTGLDPAEAIAVAQQVARALGALHAAGVVHRDVKPSNLMLVGGEVGDVKLVDFGVARRAAEPAALTRTGAMVGTAGYMAPEQARGIRGSVDARADLFALGCVLHECLTGLQAFPGDSTLATRAKVLLHDPPPLRLVAPTLPPALGAVLSKLLAKRPEERFPDGAAVEAALGEVGALPTGPGARVTVQAPTPTTVTPGELALCVIVVAWPDTEEHEAEITAIEQLAADLDVATAEPLDGGVVVTVGTELAAARQLALRIFERVPTAVVAVSSQALERATSMVGQRLLAPDACGVWLDGERLA